MAISPVGSVWRAFNVLTTKFKKLRFDCRENKVERSSPSAKLLDRGSCKFGKLNFTLFRPRSLWLLFGFKPVHLKWRLASFSRCWLLIVVNDIMFVVLC